jgi:hypothetical protein
VEVEEEEGDEMVEVQVVEVMVE